MNAKSWVLSGWCVAMIGLQSGCAPDSSADTGTAPKPGPGVVFVATNGNDAWSGSAASPKGKDGPLATVQAALKRAAESRNTPAAVKTIYIREGMYFSREPIVLTPEHSGVTIAAYGKEKPVLSGGTAISGWTQVDRDGKRCWAATCTFEGEAPRELWVNGRRPVRARHPNKGYQAIAAMPDKAAEWTQGQRRFQFKEGDIPNWKGITNAEVVVMSRWVESRLPVSGIESNIISFSKRSVFELSAGDPYYVEGAVEALDEPGEWAIDPTGTIYYLPRPGEELKTIQAIVPVASQVLRVEGNSTEKHFVEGVQLRGLTFSHAEWYFGDRSKASREKAVVSPAPSAEVGGFAQAAVGVPGAVWGEGVIDSSFIDCAFVNLGGYGLELARGCRSNLISNCEFGWLGAGGIKLGEGGIRNEAAERSGANTVTGCHIHDGGRMFHSAIGVWIGQSGGNTISSNSIHDFYYTGISVGWTWGYGSSLAQSNRVEFNHIHHIGVQSDGDGPILSDMGGIYTLGNQLGTLIRNNRWHDIAALRYGGWGIYFDEGSAGIIAENNVVFRTTHGGFHQHYGATNVLRNNIFAFARDQQLQRTRAEAHESFSFRTNIVYFNQGVLLGSNWSNDHYDMDHNLYWDARSGTNTAKFALGAGTMEQWHQRGHDQASLVADPLFMDPEHGDFRLKPGSPAEKIGFRPIADEIAGPADRKPWNQ